MAPKWMGRATMQSPKEKRPRGQGRTQMGMAQAFEAFCSCLSSLEENMGIQATASHYVILEPLIQSIPT